MANPLEVLKSAYHKTRSSIDKVFKGTKTTHYRKPAPTYKSLPARSSTGRAGDSGTFGTPAQMNKIKRAK